MFRNIFLKRNLSIEVRINYFLFFHYIAFLIFYEFVRRFLNSLNVVFLNKNYRKSAENVGDKRDFSN